MLRDNIKKVKVLEALSEVTVMEKQKLCRLQVAWQQKWTWVNLTNKPSDVGEKDAVTN